MNNHFDWSLIATYLAGECTPDEELQVKQLAEQDEEFAAALRDSQALWQGACRVRPPKREMDWNSCLHAMNRKIAEVEQAAKPIEPVITVSHRQEQSAPVATTFWSPLRIAASVVVLVCAVAVYMQFFVPADMVEVATARGQQKRVQLPDGTEVVLNVASTLRYPERFGSKRAVELTGEAFFEVAHDPSKPFTIEAEGTKVEVLGTSFNLKAYAEDQDVELTVKTGKVAFSADREKLTLLPEQSAFFLKSTGQIGYQPMSEDAVEWQEGKIIFKAATLLEVAQTLEKHFDVKVAFADEKTQKQAPHRRI